MTDTLLYRSVSVQHNAQRQRRDTNTQRSSRRGLGGADPLAREREAPRLWRCLRVTVAGTGREGWRPSRARRCVAAWAGLRNRGCGGGAHELHTSYTSTGGGCHLNIPGACDEIEMRQGGRSACPHACARDITGRLSKRPTRQPYSRIYVKHACAPRRPALSSARGRPHTAATRGSSRIVLNPRPQIEHDGTLSGGARTLSSGW